jgi:hypothetical protein
MNYFMGEILMEPSELNRVWRFSMLGRCLLVFLILVGLSPIPLAAQEGYVNYQQPYQRPGQATTTTREEKVNPDGTKTTKERTATSSQGSTYRYSGLPGKFIKSGGQSRGQSQLVPDREPRRHYRFEFASTGIPEGSDPREAFWFERRDGKLMLVDPLISQRYSGNPR